MSVHSRLPAALAVGFLILTAFGCAGDRTATHSRPSDGAAEASGAPEPPPRLSREQKQSLQEALGAALSDDEALAGALESSSFDDAMREQVRAFYAARDGEPAWVDAKSHERAQALLAAACDATTEGLDPTRWPLEDAQQTLQTHDVASELFVTATLLQVAHDLRYGQVEPDDMRWNIEREKRPPHELLADALEERDPAAALRPRHPLYAPLLEAAASLDQLAARGGWPKVSAGPVLEEGDEDPRVVEVKRRLAATGELEGDVDSPLFDADLAEALRTFQRRNGLEEDGKVGGNTQRALSATPADWAKQVRVNLERLRWLPEEIEGRHVVVNVAGYELEAKDGEKVLFRSPVVVGEAGWATPVMVSGIVRLEVNPKWNVPPRMTRERILPRVQEDPEYPLRNGMTVIDRTTGQAVDPRTVDWTVMEPGQHRFVQRAGPRNPMGEVKLAMDNRFQIYLHGTPEPEAFEQSRRALSHGCVRVKELDALSRFVLPRDVHGEYADALETGEEAWLELAEPLPVYFVYVTAWVDEGGTLQLRPDPYGRDRRLARALGAPDEGALACR